MHTKTTRPSKAQFLVSMAQAMLTLENEQARLAEQVALLENGQELILDMAERMSAATEKRMDAKIKKTVKKVLLNAMSGLRVDENE